MEGQGKNAVDDEGELDRLTVGESEIELGGSAVGTAGEDVVSTGTKVSERHIGRQIGGRRNIRVESRRLDVEGDGDIGVGVAEGLDENADGGWSTGLRGDGWWGAAKPEQRKK